MSGCIHRGKRSDASIKFGYASSYAYCFRVEPSVAIQVQYQEDFCLCANHANCPLLLNGAAALADEQIQLNAIVPNKEAPKFLMRRLLQRLTKLF